MSELNKTSGRLAYKDESLEYGGDVGAALLKPVNPTLTPPSLSVLASGGLLAAVGAEITRDITLTFNRGSISILGEEQDKRAGIANLFTCDGQVDPLNNVFSITKTLTEGQTEIACQVDYDEGPQPVDSLGNNFGTPLLAGSLTASLFLEGVLPIYTVLQTGGKTMQDSLAAISAYSYNTSSLELLIAGESVDFGTNPITYYKYLLQIPMAWVESFAGIQFLQYDPLITQDYTIDITSNLAPTPIVKNIGGTDYDYMEFVNTNGAISSGDLKLKILFS